MPDSSPPLDLLVVADSLDGGLGAAATSHAAWFDAHGWRVALAAPGAGPEAGRQPHTVDIPEAGSAFDVRSVLRAAFFLRSVIRGDGRPSIVHAHGTRSQLLCLLAGRRPYVTMHGSGGRIEGQGVLGALVRTLARRLAARLAVSAYCAAPASGGWETLLHASPRLADLDVLPPADGDVPTFVWVGRLDAPKRPELFVEACALAHRVTPLRGVVVGDGPLLDELRAQVAHLGAPVDVRGATDDVTSALREARAVCLFSDFEGVPFTVQEAMWAGRAMVLSPLPGLRWFAGDTATYASEPRAIADAMLELCDRDLASARGQLAADRIRGLLHPEDPFPRLLSDYGGRR